MTGSLMSKRRGGVGGEGRITVVHIVKSPVTGAYFELAKPFFPIAAMVTRDNDDQVTTTRHTGMKRETETEGAGDIS